MANSFDPYAAQAGSYGVAPDLQFYSGVSGPSASTSSGMGSMAHNASAGTSSGGMDYYSGFSGSGGVAASGNMQSNGVGGAMIPIVGFWSAFTAAPMYEGEPPLLEELGFNFEHIKLKSLTVLNPLRKPDQHIMDDADLAGPILFAFCFGMFLLLSGKSQFGYIYGVALLGDASIYFLLNLMSPTGIDAYRVSSVLGYCLLPIVLTSLASVAINLDGLIGYLMSGLSVFWCSYAASGIFVSVLQMQNQRALVAYPVSLFYAAFSLLTVFQHRVLVK
ncbi:hypothetical protein EMMF5_000348 [Cystobasidiomycetes sp. EMM_F5]